MTLNELIRKLQEFQSSMGEANVMVLEAMSGDLAEIDSVNLSMLNGGQIHIAIELEYED